MSSWTRGYELRLVDDQLPLEEAIGPEVAGSHVSYRHPEGYAIMQALIAQGVIGDYREPRVLRFGVTPLYVRSTDIWDAVDALFAILETRQWERPDFRERLNVTS